MKFKHHQSWLALLLLPLIAPSIAINPQISNNERRGQRVPRDVEAGSPAVEKNTVSPLPNPVGTKDAPIDGKDGMPHDGPFVETEAERSRKKAKESTDEEPAVPAAASPVAKVEVKEQADLRPSNDGVMDDPHRVGPKDGTRGTEGGVSEKSKESKVGTEKTPDAPKEAPALPQSEQDVSQGGVKGDKQGGGAETVPKISDDYDSKSSIDKNADSKSASSGDASPPVTKSPPSNQQSLQPDESGVIQPLHSLFLSFAMILVSEIGDKTFIVAALMAMRHPRTVVFSAAFAAMIVMTVLSAFLGHALPSLIPKSMTNFLAAILFLVFGIKMYLEARKMSPDEGVSEEMKEVEMELEEKEHQQRRVSRRRSSVDPYTLESGQAGRKSRSSNGRLPSPPDSPSPSSSRDGSPSRGSHATNALNGVNNLLSLLLSPAWVQTFVMTFLGEWGDRSQIATIAMAAGQDYWWVIGGALGGHFICTGAAVLGGAAIAGRVSLRVVTMGGAIAFLVFGFIYLFEAVY